ncbi:MAG TPA: helix-turn-helix domain-containing protein [Verrucomicrobiae bacterium]|nr:helix-turn-helix domain-containing protein [Verrucomicrobiae bacterium]
MEKLRSTLRELGLSKNEAKVYAALTTLGEAKASVVAKKVDLSRTTVISILSRLEEGGFVSANKYKGVISYWVESPNVLKETLEAKLVVADHLNLLLTDMYRADSAVPAVKVLDTRDAIRSFIEREIATLKKGDEILTIDSPLSGNYQKVLSDEYYYAMLNMKDRRGISTKTLVPAGSVGDVDPQKLAKQRIELRQLPEGVDFDASLWIMGNKLYLFSGTPPLVVMIKHQSIVASMESLFMSLWEPNTN